MLVVPDGFDWAKEWKTVAFTDTLEVIGIERGRSAAHFLARSQEDGALYTIFLIDLLHMLPAMAGQTVAGTFVVVKRGMDLGICLQGTRISPTPRLWEGQTRKMPAYVR